MALSAAAIVGLPVAALGTLVLELAGRRQGWLIVLRGEVSAVLAEVRQRVGAGDPDPAEPLRAVRDRIGRRANGVLFTAGRRRMLAGHLRLAGASVVVLTVLDRTLAT